MSKTERFIPSQGPDTLLQGKGWVHPRQLRITIALYQISHLY